MVFAVFDIMGIAAVGAAVGASVLKGAEAVMLLLKGRNDANRAARIDSLNEWKDIVDRQEKHIQAQVEQTERKDRVIDQFQQVVSSLTAEHADCREETAALRQAVHNLYDWLVKVWPPDKGVPPPMPKIPVREGSGKSEFLLRQAEQSAILVKQADSSIKALGGVAPSQPGDGNGGKTP